jgi:hypothetical protein
MSYELRQYNREEWVKLNPRDEIAAVLDAYPGARVVFQSGTEWRRAPRDTGLVRELANIIRNETGLPGLEPAQRVYDFLEERGKL